MAWSRALVYALLAAVLGALYVATAPPPPPQLNAAESPTPGLAIESVQIDADGRTVRATRSDERWTVVEPAASHVPSDLIAALVSAVLETPAEPVVGSADQMVEFGLDTPSARVVFSRANGDPITVALGSTNPAETGVYARLAGNPQIILLGLNVRYYIDLALKESAEP
jgi:Domain of unknown function (DUF4340)